MILGNKPTNPGDLRTQISLLKRTVSTSTGGFQTPATTKIADVWAKWENVHGSEVWSAAAINAIQPATVLGLPTFLLQPSAAPDGLNSGSFSDLKNWLPTITGRPTTLPATPEAMLAVLSSTPTALDSIAAKLRNDGWRLRPEKNEWSMGEIFCHLRDVDRDVTLPRIERILAEDAPFITAEATDSWAEERQYALEDPAEALNGFLQTRTQLLLALRKLDQTAWSRPARHAIFGPTTLTELITFTITHDQNHVRQVGETLRALKK